MPSFYLMQNFSPIAILNEALTSELVAINQYFIDSKIFKDMGFLNLSNVLRSHSIGEMHHADTLIDRILYCKGSPRITYRDTGACPRDAKKIFEKDRDLELEALSLYRRAIGELEKNHDFGSAALIRALLKDEEEHLEWLEQQLSLIERLGIQQYLVKHG